MTDQQEWIDRQLAQAPPLTDEQAAKIADALRMRRRDIHSPLWNVSDEGTSSERQ